jgi:hypothetical protein
VLVITAAATKELAEQLRVPFFVLVLFLFATIILGIFLFSPIFVAKELLQKCFKPWCM